MRDSEQPAKPRNVTSRPAPMKLPRHRTAGPGAALFALFVLLVGIAAGAFWKLTPVAATEAARQVDILFNTMLGIAAAIFLMVEGTLVYFALRYRRKDGDESDGWPIHGSNRLEIAWSIIPALIVLWLGVYSFQILANIRNLPGEVPEDAMVIEVIGRQWQWEFHYPDSNITSTRELRLPANTPVLLKITAEDVLHSFWVPAFRLKQDAVPLHETEIFFTPDLVGTYELKCAEFCGLRHARMVSQVIVQDQADFAAWVIEQQSVEPLDPVALFTEFGCNGCHTLADAGAIGQVGPNLNEVGARADERVPGLAAESYIHQSIITPDAFVVPGFQPLMPKNFAERMTDEQLDTLVIFLLAQE